MFSNTAYEAYFVSLGVYIHAGITKFLSSDQFFRSLLLFISAVTLLILVFQYFSRHLPGSLFERRYISLSKLFKFVFCFFLGVSLLRLGTDVDFKKYSRDSWRENPYMSERLSKNDEDYRVSFVFDVLIRTIEEIGWGATKLVDRLMGESHSHLEAPDFFYKAIMLAGSSQIKDPKLKETIDLYSEECVERALAEGPDTFKEVNLGKFFTDDFMASELDLLYRSITFERDDGATYNCNDLRQAVNQGLYEESKSYEPVMNQLLTKAGLDQKISTNQMRNLEISSAVLNYYRSKREDWVGTKNEVKVPGGFGSTLQFLGKLVSIEGWARLFGNEDAAGASLAVDKAKEFNELLRKGPMIKGLVKMFLIALAPLLMFPIVAMRWKVLIWWVVAYSSVTIGWSVCWTFLYHTLTNFVASGSILTQFGKMSDAYSLSSAQMIMEDAYYFYSVIFTAQMMSAISLTGGSLFFTRSLLSDTRGDHMPEIVPVAANAALAANGIKGTN